jgi:parallel beta-helix repeat protein
VASSPGIKNAGIARQMMLLVIIAAFHSLISSAQSTLDLSAGMKITSSVTITSKEFMLDAATSLDTSVIMIEGNDIVVDFNEAVLRSSLEVTQPDRFRGIAIFIRNSKNVTLKNANIHGYKIAVRAENVSNLTIENCNFSYNFRKKLKSTPRREDISDWMSFHHNENSEWLHYGAGIYLTSCPGVLIENNRITGGQCALLMSRCNDGRILNNDFSFNSALGIGMYRCSNNEVMYNRLDWNMRGFSFGVYNRGQDSAGILVYEQSNYNVFAYNSATHSGDGFFLWAGLTTMDTGEGGCNDNLIFGNNFSYASNNGIEATFSRNNFVNNKVAHCDYGVWGGYSYHSVIGANEIDSNRIGIAIEHGQRNHILYNEFVANKIAVKLWANQSQPSDWAYAQKRDTRSTNTRIEHNTSMDNDLVYDFTRCDSIYINNNHWTEDNKVYRPNNTNRMINFGRTVDSVKKKDIMKFIAAFDPAPGSKVPGDPPHSGKHNIMITQYGPYDFRRPVLWLQKSDSTGNMHFRILGPKGNWKLSSSSGLKLSRSAGSVPDTITAKVTSSSPELNTTLTFTGEKITDEFGRITAAGIPFTFSWSDFELLLTWRVEYFRMDTFNPVSYPGVFTNAIRRGVLRADTVNKLEFVWWGAPASGIPEDHFALVATTRQHFADGEYTVGITADDGVRLYVDEKLVLDEWDISKYKFNDELHHTATLHLKGTHSMRVEYFDQTGFATLMVRIEKKQMNR